MPVSLTEAIETCYMVFRRYPLKSHIEGCPCCVGEEDRARLHSRSLRALTNDDLEPFVSSAMTTWGDDEDFRHFLPRLLELVTGAPHDEIGTEVFLSKLAYATWSGWSEAEQTAVASVLWLRWTTGLGRDPQDFDADAWLCGVTLAGVQTSDYVEAWRTSTAPTAFAHVVDFLETNPDLLSGGRLTNAFYFDEAEADVAHAMREWLSAALAEPEFEARLADWYQHPR